MRYPVWFMALGNGFVEIHYSDGTTETLPIREAEKLFGP